MDIEVTDETPTSHGSALQTEVSVASSTSSSAHQRCTQQTMLLHILHDRTSPSPSHSAQHNTSATAHHCGYPFLFSLVLQLLACGLQAVLHDCLRLTILSFVILNDELVVEQAISMICLIKHNVKFPSDISIMFLRDLAPAS